MDGNTAISSRVGFIGVGIMGGPMAKRLIEQGLELTVHDVDLEATERLRAVGATVASSPREVADRAETVFACLPSPTICRAVALGPDGVSGGKRIRHYIETSTTGSRTSAEIAAELGKHRIVMLDAPISGGPTGAEAGKLTSILAGPKEVVESCRPLIHHYSEHIFHVSERQGGAQLSKLINNSIVIFAMLTTFEALVVAEEAKLDIRTLVSLLNVSTAANHMSKVIIPNGLLAENPKPAGRMEIMLKDLHLYMEEARALGLNLRVADMLTQVTEDAGPDPDQDPPEAVHHYLSRVAHETSPAAKGKTSRD